MKLPLHKQQLGKLGENLAVSYLQKRGYRIIDRNFKIRYGEIDIICTKEDTLVFIEVKTRIGTEFGMPEEAVTAKKLRQVVKTAEYYHMLHNHLPKAQRVDVIGIQLDHNDAVVYFNHLVSVT